MIRAIPAKNVWGARDGIRYFFGLVVVLWENILALVVILAAGEKIQMLLNFNENENITKSLLCFFVTREHSLPSAQAYVYVRTNDNSAKK